MKEEEDTSPTEPVVQHIFITADCGCRFQVVSGMPVLNAGVLAMPDTRSNVCNEHHGEQEKAEENARAAAKNPKSSLLDIHGQPIRRSN